LVDFGFAKKLQVLFSVFPSFFLSICVWHLSAGTYLFFNAVSL
jgi:hypothetical protein